MTITFMGAVPTQDLGDTTNSALRHWRHKAAQLVENALQEGVVIRVETTPIEPLAMGNFNIEIHVHPLRNYKNVNN